MLESSWAPLGHQMALGRPARTQHTPIDGPE